MIEKIIYGNPFETYSVVEEVKQASKIKFFNFYKQNGNLVFEYALSKDDIVYGLGETMRGINKRGGKFVSFNTDQNNHTQDTQSLYGSHNFLIVDGKEHFGAFFDTPSKVTFEIDFNNSGKITVVCENENLNLYIISGENSYDITKQFLKIIGQSFIPPLWAFGFGQSKWGYKNPEDFENVMNNYRKNHLPLDYICMDIDYMDRYIDFSIDKNKFDNMEEFVKKFKKENVRLVPIIDAGIKIERGNKVYEEGIKNNYFCKDAQGNNFEALVWPGLTHFTDFFKPKAREWFGMQYKALTDLGFEGFWNDMNEPSIFSNAFDEKNSQSSSNIEKIEDKQKVDDYKKFYHDINGKMVVNYDVHNVYGHFMTMAAGEQLKNLIDKRYLLFTRSTYVGSHRYGGLWTGDNASLWEHLKQNLLQMPSLNMCGLIYSGADTGGFKKNCSAELLLRWLALSTFTPLMRIHSSRSASPQECYSFGQNEIDKFRNILQLRYRLLPYIYSEFVKAALRCDMFIKPLAFEFDDNISKTIETQLLVGESIMIAPIIEEGQIERDVYLPENMTQVTFKNGEFICKPLSKGEHKITANLDEVVFFIRNNKLVPVAKAVECTDKIDLNNVSLLGNGQIYEQYIDDGFTKNVTLDNIRLLKK